MRMKKSKYLSISSNDLIFARTSNLLYTNVVPLNTRREGLFSHVDGSYSTIVTYRGIVYLRQ